MNTLSKPVHFMLALLILLGVLIAPVAAPALADTFSADSAIQGDAYDWSDDRVCINGYDWSDGRSCPRDYDWSDGD
jgi:hypothetical protein